VAIAWRTAALSSATSPRMRGCVGMRNASTMDELPSLLHDTTKPPQAQRLSGEVSPCPIGGGYPSIGRGLEGFAQPPPPRRIGEERPGGVVQQVAESSTGHHPASMQSALYCTGRSFFR
jgi:hypothetical protein